MTPDKNFRMKKSTKTLVALLKFNSEARHQFRRSMVEAQLCEEAARRASLKSKDTSGKPRGAVAPD